MTVGPSRCCSDRRCGQSVGVQTVIRICRRPTQARNSTIAVRSPNNHHNASGVWPIRVHHNFGPNSFRAMSITPCSFMAKPILPLIFSFPRMNAICGFIFPCAIAKKSLSFMVTVKSGCGHQQAAATPSANASPADAVRIAFQPTGIDRDCRCALAQQLSACKCERRQGLIPS